MAGFRLANPRLAIFDAPGPTESVLPTDFPAVSCTLLGGGSAPEPLQGRARQQELSARDSRVPGVSPDGSIRRSMCRIALVTEQLDAKTAIQITYDRGHPGPQSRNLHGMPSFPPFPCGIPCGAPCSAGERVGLSPANGFASMRSLTDKTDRSSQQMMRASSYRVAGVTSTPSVLLTPGRLGARNGESRW
jgi:hypothetical protein